MHADDFIFISGITSKKKKKEKVKPKLKILLSRKQPVALWVTAIVPVLLLNMATDEVTQVHTCFSANHTLNMF